MESLKEMKKIQKEQLAKQYDEMVANAKPKEEEEKENNKRGNSPSIILVFYIQ